MVINRAIVFYVGNIWYLAKVISTPATAALLQSKDGWLAHPVDEGFRQEQGGKTRTIPIRLLFNDPDLNFRAEYYLFCIVAKVAVHDHVNTVIRIIHPAKGN